MSTKIFYNNNRIIIDGHADTPEECQAITAMCDSLANDENFKTIVYEKGHAVFERIDGGDAMMFAMQDYVLTSRYNNETGYSSTIWGTKGSIAKRLDDIEKHTGGGHGGVPLVQVVYDNKQAIQDITARLDAFEAEILRLAQMESRFKALENKASKTLPYTADELITKLESI